MRGKASKELGRLAHNMQQAWRVATAKWADGGMQGKQPAKPPTKRQLKRNYKQQMGRV